MHIWFPTCRHFFINVFKRHIRMSDTKRLKAIALQISQAIGDAKKELAELETLVVESFSKKSLQIENKEFVKIVEKYKQDLISLEVANGTTQIYTSKLAPNKAEQESKLIIQVAPQEWVKREPEEVLRPECAVTEKPKKETKKKERQKVGQTDEKHSDGGSEPPVDVGRLDLRIGRIVDIKKHPDADSLYVEKIDIGIDKPITVVSGLVKYVPMEEISGRLVVLLCNLKPAKMRGVTSEAMVMCASTPGKVEVLDPPKGSIPGDRVSVPGYPSSPDQVLNPKKKIFETVAPDLKTDNSRVATYKGAPWTVKGKGHVTTHSLTGVNIK